MPHPGLGKQRLCAGAKPKSPSLAQRGKARRRRDGMGAFRARMNAKCRAARKCPHPPQRKRCAFPRCAREGKPGFAPAARTWLDMNTSTREADLSPQIQSPTIAVTPVAEPSRRNGRALSVGRRACSPDRIAGQVCAARGLRRGSFFGSTFLWTRSKERWKTLPRKGGPRPAEHEKSRPFAQNHSHGTTPGPKGRRSDVPPCPDLAPT